MENGCMDSFHEARRTYSHCALITLSALLLIQGLGLLLSWLVRDLSLRPQDALLITQLPQPLVLIPAYFWLRPKERETASPGAIRPEEFPALFLAALPIIYGGNLLGNLLASLLTMGRAVNRLGELSSRMTVPLALYVTCVGPLAEELFFRGMILPRLTRFGQKMALVFSALLFALYHVNLYQFFYAWGLGLLLGALYLKTGSIRMGYVLHAAINLLGSVLPPLLLSLSLEAVAVFGLPVDQMIPQALHAVRLRRDVSAPFQTGNGLSARPQRAAARHRPAGRFQERGLCPAGDSQLGGLPAGPVSVVSWQGLFVQLLLHLKRGTGRL